MSIRLPSLFSDSAVLQQGITVPVWGWAPRQILVTVTLGRYCAVTKSDPCGYFRAELAPMPAGGPHDLTVTSDGHSVVVKDVYVGEVWLASGQSNMEWTMQACGLNQEEVDIPNLRMITVNQTAVIGQRDDFEGNWQTPTPRNVQMFSAVSYFFARRLCEELDVMVGIINSSWGGTRAEAWTSRETLARNPDYAPWMRSYHRTVNTREYWETRAAVVPTNPYPADPGNHGVAKGWAGLGFDDQPWPEMVLPSTWQAAAQDYSGVFWFRKTLDIPAEWAGQDLMLGLGAVDKQDITYFNGEVVGATGTGFDEEFWNVNRVYQIPGHLVRPGRNVIAVRAYSFAFGGGLIGPAAKMAMVNVAASGPPIPLAGAWRFHVEHDFGLIIPPPEVPGEGCPNSPHMLFDNMITPLLSYGIRGAIWYQGESNADAANQYRHLLVEMIRCWRHAWGQGDFPFIQVQLANFTAPSTFDPLSNWALLREAQLQATCEPGVQMAVAIDIGESDDIHPKNKPEVGHRLALLALAQTYGRQTVPSGPLYSGMMIEHERIRIHFDFANAGLVAKGGVLTTFVIAGSDRCFVEAEALIDGNTVVVWSEQVSAPMAVRYAWADNPEGCNLYNSEGLPASPFRSDSWPQVKA